MSYETVTGTVNKDVKNPDVRYVALILTDPPPANPQMEAIIHYTIKGNSRVLTVVDMNITDSIAPFFAFIYQFVKNSAGAPLTVDDPSTSLVVSSIIVGNNIDDPNLAKLNISYSASLKGYKTGGLEYVSINKAQFDTVAAMSTFVALNASSIISQSLTFTLA